MQALKFLYGLVFNNDRVPFNWIFFLLNGLWIKMEALVIAGDTSCTLAANGQIYMQVNKHFMSAFLNIFHCALMDHM